MGKITKFKHKRKFWEEDGLIWLYTSDRVKAKRNCYALDKQIIIDIYKYMHYNFEKDLKDGEKYEKLFGQYLEKKGYKIEYSEGNFKDFDILAQKDKDMITYEIKKDFITATTGNLAVEYKCNGKLSGLAATKAEYYVIIDEKYINIFRTKEFKEWIGMNKKWFKIVKGGDNKKAFNILIPRALIYNLSFVETLPIEYLNNNK